MRTGDLHKELDLKRGVRIFLALTVTALLLVLVLSAGEYTWNNLFRPTAWKELLRRETWLAILTNLSGAFRAVNLLSLMLCLGVVSIHYYLQCLRLQLLSWATGKFISLKTSMEFTFGGLFLGAVTPFQSGGIPLQLWVLGREGLSVGEGGAVILFRGALSLSVLVVALPFIFPYRAVLGSGAVNAVIKYLLVFYALFLFILFSALFRTGTLRRHAFTLADWLKRKRVARGERLHRFLAGAFEQVTDFKRALRDYFGKGKGRLTLSFLATLLAMALYFLLAPTLLFGIGVPDVPVTKAIVLGMIIAYLLPFVPTPGASGIAEVVSSALFFSVCPRHLLGVYVLLWRLLTFYLGVIAGAVVILRMLRPGLGPPS